MTEQFLLRPMVAADITSRCCSWFEDHALSRHFDPEGAVDAAMLNIWVERAARVRSSYLIAICDRRSDQLIGLIKTSVRGDLATSSLIVGETQYWGRNVAVEAHAAWRRHLFAQGVRRFCFRVSRRNLFMLGKLEKLPGLVRGEQRGTWVTFTMDASYVREPPSP